MRVTRIKLTNVRRYAEVEHAGLEPGLNVFVGPNGIGKSSLVAAISAAFLQRYGTTTVKDLQGPDHGRGATVEVDFEWDGKRHALSKTFLRGESCVLDIEGRRLLSAEAEDHLAQMMGYEFGTRGSKEDQWGVPGLLWVQQGTGQDVHKPVSHAVTHLRGALQASVEDVASTDGDVLIAKVEAQRNIYLNARGQPRDRYEAAIKALEAAREELRTVEATASQFRQNVDRMVKLQGELDRMERERPWEQAETRARQAAEALRKIEAQTNLFDKKQAQLDKQLTSRTHINTRLADFQQQENTLAERMAKLPDLEEASAAATNALSELDALIQQAADFYQAAREAELRAVDQERRETLQARRQSLLDSIDPLRERLCAAKAAEQDAQALDTQAKATAQASKALPALQRQQTEIGKLRARLEGAASTVHLDLRQGIDVLAGGRRVDRVGIISVTEPTVFELDGVGSLTVLPGGSEVAQCRADLDKAQSALNSALAELGAVSVEKVQEEAARHAEYSRDLDGARTRLGALAPHGVAQLEATLLQQERQLEAVACELEQMAPPAGTEALSPQDARAQRAAAEADLQAKQTDRTEASTRKTLAVEREAAARREIDELRNRLESPDAVAERERLRAELLDLALQITGLEEECRVLKAAIDENAAEDHRQDEARFRKSAELMRQQCQQLKDSLNDTKAWVRSRGADGVDDQVAQRRRDVEQAERRVNEQAHQARAWDHLLKLLKEERKQLTQRLQEPLQRRVDHYLRRLFPNGGLQVDEELSPRSLRTDVQHAAAGEDFSALSFGTKEQIGILSRLAYADLLKEAGRPTLLIFDDILVHADEARLDAMKRVLVDAATRHQILLLSCHPERWRDLPVLPRRLDALSTDAKPR
jgi:DNA repair exonuclease SbcCD ATPase subunit